MDSNSPVVPSSPSLANGSVNEGEHELVLVVDDEEGIRQLLIDYLESEGFPVVAAKDGNEGVEMFKARRPSIVVTDVQMPGMDGMGVLRAIRREDPDAKVVVMTGFGEGAVALEALRGGASNFIKKPLSLEELLFILKAHERMIRSLRRQRLPIENIVEEHKVLRIPNDSGHVFPVVRNATRSLESFLTPHEIESVSLALSEALVNGIEHGNLGIGYQQKSDALRHNRYQQMLEERMADPECAGKSVLLEMNLNPEEATFRVTDQGTGFDWRNRPDPTLPENLLKENGRGLSIIFLFMDGVSFNEAGNEIVMRKTLSLEDEV